MNDEIRVGNSPSQAMSMSKQEAWSSICRGSDGEGTAMAKLASILSHSLITANVLVDAPFEERGQALGALRRLAYLLQEANFNIAISEERLTIAVNMRGEPVERAVDQFKSILRSGGVRLSWLEGYYNDGGHPCFSVGFWVRETPNYDQIKSLEPRKPQTKTDLLPKENLEKVNSTPGTKPMPVHCKDSPIWSCEIEEKVEGTTSNVKHLRFMDKDGHLLVWTDMRSAKAQPIVVDLDWKVVPDLISWLAHRIAIRSEDSCNA